VPIPSGWQPPELEATPAAPPGPHAHAPHGARPLAGAGAGAVGGARCADRETRGDEPAPPVRAFDDISAAWDSGGGGGGGGGGSGYGHSSEGGGRGARGGTPPPHRRAASPSPRARAPRTLIEAPEWADERTASQLLLEGVLGEVREQLSEALTLTLALTLALTPPLPLFPTSPNPDQVRERLHAKRSRPADIFRAWDRDGGMPHRP